MPHWQRSRSKAISVKTEKHNKYNFFPTLFNCCVPPWLSAGKRIPGHKSFPNSHYLLFNLNRGSFWHFHKDPVILHQDPGLAAATQYQGSSVSPASPQQALGPCHSHQILRLCIFHQHSCHTKPVTDRQGPLLTSCPFPCWLQKGVTAKTLQQLCWVLHNFAAPHQDLKDALTHFVTAIFAARAGDC